MTKPALIFDIDGTLVDSTDSVVEQLRALSREFAGRDISRAEIIEIVHTSGGSLPKMLPLLLGETTEELLVKIRSRHGELLKMYNHLLKPYIGAIEVLDQLQKAGYKMAIFTSRPKWMIDGDPACTLLRPYFTAVIALEDTPRAKPYPDGVIAALAALDATAENAVVIGDTVPDIQSAHAASVKAIAVTHGFGARAELISAEADYVIDDLSSLLPLLASWEQ
jgi:pyrophosphatase PpaX